LFLTKIDEILAWDKRNETERDTRFVELGRYLCEVRAGQYWRVERLKSFDDFLERRFPESRRKAYYLMSIHEHLPPPPAGAEGSEGSGLDEGVRTCESGPRGGSGLQLCNLVAQSAGDADGALPARGEKELTGRETEPNEIIYFKVYKSQIPAIEQPLETAALMLVSCL